VVERVSDGADITAASVSEFRGTLAKIVAAYLRHFEPTVKTDLLTIRLEATGPDLLILFAQDADQPASITVTMARVGADSEQQRRRG